MAFKKKKAFHALHEFKNYDRLGSNKQNLNCSAYDNLENSEMKLLVESVIYKLPFHNL